MLDFYGESHIIKVIKVEANESIGSPKRKDPLPERHLRKGVFLRLPACQSLSLWERWHCEAMTERASPARKSRRRSDRQALCQSDTIAAPVILGQQPCPLSLVALLLASSPKGGAIGMSVRLPFVQPLSLLRRQLP